MGAPGARSPSARTQRTPLSCPTIPASSPPTTPSPIRRQLDAVAAPVILAQSGAGPLLPASARTLKASHQVWLAAWVPDPQASFVEEFEAHAEVAFNPDWIRKDPVEGRHRRGDVRLPRLRRGDARVGLGTHRLFPPRAVYDERISLTAGIPSTSIVATKDRMVRPQCAADGAHWGRCAADGAQTPGR
jgi:hypothetical protein